ncbi:MAG: CapA family protein [Rhodobacteraceae bacterium]|nr:CapA family protein [Paracoccaceae bacterium]
MKRDTGASAPGEGDLRMGDMAGRQGAGGTMRVIVTGDSILNHSAAASRNPAFLEVVDLLRSADVCHTQMETLLHNYEAPELYPAAEGAWGWMRGPKAAAQELRDFGINVMSMASNHTLDYSYGGLFETWKALEAAGVPHCGTGRDLAESRMPAFLDTAQGRVGLVSCCSSFPMFSRAGDRRADMGGRPGLNPLRYHWRVDAASAEAIIEMCRMLGLWVTRVGNEFTVNPAGIHNTLWRFRVGEDGPATFPDEDDLAANLAAIRHARDQADMVIAHLHAHEFNAADGRISSTAEFIETYARAAVDAGAHLFIAQGSHAPMRGIEIYKGVPIFYDPGDLFRLGRPDKVPADFYTRWGYGPEARQPGAGPVQAYSARNAVFGWGDQPKEMFPTPREIYSHGPGFFIPLCEMDANYRVTRITIRPCTWLTGSKAEGGLPAFARGDTAQAILRKLAELSAPYGTDFTIAGDTAVIDLTRP